MSASPACTERVETVHEDVIEAVLPADHPLAGRTEIALAELADEPFVLWPREGAPGFHDEIVAACAQPRDVRMIPVTGNPIAARIDAVWHDGAADPRRTLVLDAARTEGRTLA